MARIKQKLWKSAAVLPLLLVIGLAASVLAGIKDRDVDSTGPDFTKKTIVIHLQGQYSADTTAVVKFKNNEDWKLLKVYQVARAVAGTCKIDVQDDAVSIFSSTVPLTTSITDDSPYFTAPLIISAGSVITVDLDLGTTIDDATVELVYRSKVATE